MERISKQVIVIRKDLKNSKGEKVRSGKIIAQACHASMKAILDLGKTDEIYIPGIAEGTRVKTLNIPLKTTALEDWLNGRFTKICVSVNSEEELVAIYEQAKAKGLICSLITDAGLTEFNGVPTKTCAAIGPDEVDEITGKLPLL
jgi:peptidyl-tRNA hydrolase, PTH2 family